MRRFTLTCDFGGRPAPFHVYIGKALAGQHPLEYQAAWLREQRGGTVPGEVMDAFAELCEIARENELSFEDLCVFALSLAAPPVKEEET